MQTWPYRRLVMNASNYIPFYLCIQNLQHVKGKGMARQKNGLCYQILHYFFHLNIYFCMCAYIYEITCLWNIYFFFKKSSTKRYIKHKIFVLELFQSLTYKLFEVSINYCLWTCPKLQESFSQTHTLQRSNPSRITASTNANNALGSIGPYLCSIWHEFSTPWTQEFVQKHTGKKKKALLNDSTLK